jgi:hypothetical protein
MDTLLLMDNVSTAMGLSDPPPGGDVPEVSTVLLGGSGLVLIGLWRRMTKRT